MPALKPKVEEFFDRLKKLEYKLGRFPTVEEIVKNLKLSSKSVAHYYLVQLEDAKLVNRNATGQRGFSKAVRQVPMFTAQAGRPGESQIGMKNIDVRELLMPSNNKWSLHPVVGESMVYDDVLEGDVLVVEHVNDCRVGDTVLAQVDGGFTVKELGKKGLKSYGDGHSDIIPCEQDNIEVIGIVRSIIRKR